MSERVLSHRALLVALLDRQLLLERSKTTIVEALEQVGGLQTQYAPSGYVGLWTRVDGFERDALTKALEDRDVIQASLMRTTIHMVSRREYWPYALGVREARRAWSLRMQGSKQDPSAAMVRGAEAMRQALADGPRTVKELGPLGAGFVGNLGLWIDLVRVPPSGTWERRRADRLALAEQWVGTPKITEEEGREHLVRAYLRAFGPANWRDIGSWAGLSVTEARTAGERLDLARYEDEAGRELIDLSGSPLPDPDTPIPVRFLPHWDATLLVHARRTGLLPEPHRPRVFSTKNPFSVGTYLVDGVVAGAWSVRDGRVELDPYQDISTAQARAVEREREALEAFHR